MTRHQKYKTDQLIEAGVAQFLDDNFYGKLKASTTRWHDKEHQFAGIDVTVKNTHFDEKVKIRGCLNTILQYPSFEVSLLNKGGDVQDGWFTQKLSTDYYAFIGVYAYTDDENSISSDSQISACDILWVKKQDVIDMVEKQMDIDQLKVDAQDLREDEIGAVGGKNRKKYKHSKFWLTYSAWMPEKPVNLVVPRQNLEKLPHTKHMVATKEGVKVI